MGSGPLVCAVLLCVAKLLGLTDQSYFSCARVPKGVGAASNMARQFPVKSLAVAGKA